MTELTALDSWLKRFANQELKEIGTLLYQEYNPKRIGIRVSILLYSNELYILVKCDQKDDDMKTYSYWAPLRRVHDESNVEKLLRIVTIRFKMKTWIDIYSSLIGREFGNIGLIISS